MTVKLDSGGAPPLFIGSEIYRHSSYGARHPLAIPRVSICIDLCRSLGWLPDNVYIDSPQATEEQLARFHDRDYIAALQIAGQNGTAPYEIKERYNFGRNGNPIFPEMFTRPATVCGASLYAADRLAESASGLTFVFNPAGGTHHGRPGRASGFCYFNDPVLAVLRLLDRGLERVLYLDFDAHHADGVQDALSGEERVRLVSVHEDGRWPMDGSERGGVLDRGGGNAINIPVPSGFNDSELDLIVDVVVLPLIDEFAPQVVVLQCGADALEDDPLSRLSLSNGALWRTVSAVKAACAKLLLLGGGGYNPWAVGRCWAGLWAVLNDLPFPERLPEEAESLLREITWRHRFGHNPPEHWFMTLADPPRYDSVRPEVRDVLAKVFEGVQISGAAKCA